MSDSFDPYRVWLGIPPESRPPTHHELLGISPKETEAAVINAAVVRQSAYVRNFQVGKHATDANRILTELAIAKTCLLDPAKRATYDAEFKARQPAAATAPPPVAARIVTPVAPPAPSVDLDLLTAAAMPSPPLLTLDAAEHRPSTRSSESAVKQAATAPASPSEKSEPVPDRVAQSTDERARESGASPSREGSVSPKRSFALALPESRDSRR
ncbi:MAG: hypothetical protein ACREHD_00580 [Pirellulales bacterium]